MEKRLLLAVFLSALVLLLYYFTLEPSPPMAEKPPGAVQEESTETEIVEEYRQVEREIPGEKKGSSRVSASEGEDIVVETDLYRLVLTTSGARVKSFRLKKYAEKWKTEKAIAREINLIDKNLAKIKEQISNAGSSSEREILESKEEFLTRSKRVLLFTGGERERREREIEELEREFEEAVAKGDSARAGEIREDLKVERGVELVPAVSILYEDYPLTVDFPALGLDFNAVLFSCSSENLYLTEGGTASLEFQAEVDGVKVSKNFTFSHGDYIVGVDVVIENVSPEVIEDNRAMLVYGPGVGLVEQAQVRGATRRIASYITGRPKARFEILEGRRTTIAPGVVDVRVGDFEWVALRSKYFAVAIVPPEKERRIMVGNLTGGGQVVGAGIPLFSIAEGEATETRFNLYIGPQKAEELSKAKQSLGKIIDYGFWEPIAKAIYFLLSLFFGIVKNYGWAIVLLALFIKIVFYPLTHHSFQGMHKMQEDMKKLQPKMEALRAKYGNNQQKLNKAVMEMYRREGINPLGGCKSGCFPMLLQMPVFFALYAVLYNSIDLRGTNFIGWITDLSAPDPWGVLPVLMGVSMFWQQKLTGMGGGMATSSAQQDQQKMMKWMMPVFLTVIFFRLPSGVVLYWFSFNILTGLQQFLIMKRKKDSESSSS